jgi:hypothetical protein
MPSIPTFHYSIIPCGFPTWMTTKKIQEFVAIPVLLIKFGVNPYPKNKEG